MCAVVMINLLPTFFLLKENKYDMLWSKQALKQKKNKLLKLILYVKMLLTYMCI